MRTFIFLLTAILMIQPRIFGQSSVLDSSDDFIVIAHRGASAYTPENTLIAFKKAIEMKAEMVELDVSVSKDGIPVVIHDKTIDRTTSGSGTVGSFTLEELKSDYEYGKWFDENFAGETIPTLEEALRLMKDQILVNIEIKSEAVTDQAEGGIVQKSLEIVRRLDMQEQVIFSSFDYRVHRQLEQLDPQIPKAILYERSQSGDLLPSELVEEYKVDAFNCSHKQLSDEWLIDLRSNDIPFLVYTVNDEDRMKEVIRSGARGIFSDKPDLLLKVVEKL